MENKTRIDVMCDIETLGTKSDSTIFQIAAIAFDIKTGEYIETFNEIADISQCDDLKITGSTLKWWLKTNKDLFSTLLHSGTMNPKQLLGKFRDFLKGLNSSKTKDSQVYLWGNGILFDNKMIQTQLESNGMSYPICYRNDRDMRTLVDLAIQKLKLNSQKELLDLYNEPNLIAHDAFDDVKQQINVACKCYNLLIGD